MRHKTLWISLAVVGLCWTVAQAMGHKPDPDFDDSQFNAKNEGTRDTHHLPDATAEKSPVGLPAKPDDVVHDTSKGFNDPFFKNDKDKDFDADTKSK